MENKRPAGVTVFGVIKIMILILFSLFFCIKSEAGMEAPRTCKYCIADFECEPAYPKLEGECVDGLPDGKWIGKNEKGVVIAEEHWLKGERNGKFISWYENGNKHSEGLYESDKKEGLWTEWHPNGVKAHEGEYKYDLMDGEWRYWHDNGTKSAEGFYKRSQPQGKYTQWDKEGMMTRETWFENGEYLKSIEYFNAEKTRYNIDLFDHENNLFKRTFYRDNQIVNSYEEPLSSKEIADQIEMLK